MATLKRQRADGTWEYVRLTGEDLLGVHDEIGLLKEDIGKHESRLNALENDTGQVATNVAGLYRETAWLKLKQEAADRIEGGVTFADDMNGNRFGFELNEEESQGVKIRDGKMLMADSAEVLHSATDATVVSVERDTSGNGGRKLVRLENGWLATVLYSGSFHLYLSKDNGKSWSSTNIFAAGWSDGYATLASYRNVVYLMFHSNATSATMVRLYTIKISDEEVKTIGPLEIETGQSGIQGGSITCDPANGHLHAAWSSKNSSYPNSFNIRYSKSTDGGATWSAVEQVTTKNNSLYPDVINPTIAIGKDGVPLIVFQSETNFNSGQSLTRPIIIVKKDNTLLSSSALSSSWSYQVVYHYNSSYPQSSPSAVVDKDGVIHVAWHGEGTNAANNSIRYSYSTNGGSSWSGMVALTSNGQNNINPSITINSKNEKFIVFRGFSNGNADVSYVKAPANSNTFGSHLFIVSGESALYTNPSTLVDKSLDFSFPLFIYQSTSKVGFFGTWISVEDVPNLTATAVYDVPTTDYVGLFVDNVGSVGIQAFVNDVELQADFVDNSSMEMKFEMDEPLPSPSPVKLRLELRRTSTDGGESDAITRILGGRA